MMQHAHRLHLKRTLFKEEEDLDLNDEDDVDSDHFIVIPVLIALIPLHMK
jgi:hypothetical protein